MPGIAFNLVLILGLILANGALAMSEIAVVSSRKVRLRQQAEASDARARRALELADSPSRFLSTVQVGITVVGIFMGAFGEATVAVPLAAFLEQIRPLGPYAEPIAFIMVVMAITYLTLVLGELVPKRIALTSPERIASLAARPMHRLSMLARPVVWLLSSSTDAVVRLLRVRPKAEPPVTEEEISALIAHGTAAGVFEEAELDLVKRVFWLADQTVGAVMTPRREIVWLDVNDPAEENLNKTVTHRHSRFIVCDRDLDHVLGMVEVKDLWAECAAGRPFDVRQRAEKPLFVPESAKALAVLEQFRESGVHLALVVDEYGWITGLTTLNDITEGLAGEIEPTRPRIARREDGSWLVDASLAMDDLLEILELKERRVEERGGYRTVGGFALMYLGRIPSVGDHFVWNGFRFEIVDMDGYRIDKVLVAKEPARDEDDEKPTDESGET